ncbi:uncharacterized protein EI97DRAFT_375477 [Westerdykella ornata]|uniref:Auxin efflux carrier n=1 Tax=Westerdykella ornata TaxID=318751 RepID=A0A6A6JN05_WESOR|nr:uncharacterized protein EI97DRAFT_375477 [Westerdykella ornata]KAF2277036.1 hypothetical protein EI97DRAFT_375477 [Westerdykella ornata]
MGSASELVIPFLGALQAAVSVLLTIFYGVVTAQFNLLSGKAAKEVSGLCVRMLLPALLIYKVGSELQQGTALRYLPILIWAIGYNLLSIAIGSVATRFFNLPSWATPAMAFNNTTSLPLLLIQSLEATGILSAILRHGDSASDAVSRAQSYFLINSTVNNSLTFALGPRLLRPGDEDAPDEEGNNEGGERGNQGDQDGQQERSQTDGYDDIIDEHTTLLPRHNVRRANAVGLDTWKIGKEQWERLPQWAQNFLGTAYMFANGPLIGAVIGAFIGLIPPLHKLFFNKVSEGGYLNAWLTTSIKNIGDLFASLQIIVVGVKLSQSLRNMKKGEASGEFSWKGFLFITCVRFLIWPAVSIPVIYFTVTKTRLLNADPMLWFAMMLMPTGPPAMILVALAEVNGSPEKQKMAIAKFLTVSYAITPLISFAVVGALKACESALTT